MILFRVLYYWIWFAVRGQPASRAALDRLNGRQLQRKLQWVIRNIPFYRPITTPDLSAFPVIDKTIFNAQFANLNVAGISRSEAYEFALRAEQTGQFRNKLRGLTAGLSTGTSGNRGVFLVSDREIAQWVAMVFVRILRLNPFRRQRIAFVFRTNSNLYQATNIGAVTMRFFPLDLDNPVVHQDLTAFRPTVLVGQPSALIRLATYKQNGTLTLNPQRVISVAEVLGDRDRDYLRAVFGTVIHQVYQCMEGFLASTCAWGNLHVNEDVVHWEKRYLDPEQQRYHPILTDFTRHTQALIRYELNDVLVEPEKPCPCGSPFTQIGRIEGRADDVLVFATESGRVVAIYPDLVRRAVCDSSDTIVSYAVYQAEPKAVVVYLDKKEFADPALREMIRTNLNTVWDQHGVGTVTSSFLPFDQREPETKLRRVKRNPQIPFNPERHDA